MLLLVVTRPFCVRGLPMNCVGTTDARRCVVEDSHVRGEASLALGLSIDDIDEQGRARKLGTDAEREIA